MATTPRKLTTWSNEKAQHYRASHAETLYIFHTLVDASPSMHLHRGGVITAYNQHLRWLQAHADPMALGHRILFDDTVRPTSVQALGTLPPLTAREYAPAHNDGTALWEAMGTVLVTQDTPGQHVVLLLSDGEDCCKRTLWTATRVRELFLTLQQERGWCGVFLGVDQDALTVGKELGFPSAHCVPLTGDQIPEAFRQFQHAMQRYLSASVAARKLLAAGGLFG